MLKENLFLQATKWHNPSTFNPPLQFFSNQQGQLEKKRLRQIVIPSQKVQGKKAKEIGQIYEINKQQRLFS